jgi:hypothetical protein
MRGAYIAASGAVRVRRSGRGSYMFGVIENPL